MKVYKMVILDINKDEVLTESLDMTKQLVLFTLFAHQKMNAQLKKHINLICFVCFNLHRPVGFHDGCSY